MIHKCPFLHQIDPCHLYHFHEADTWDVIDEAIMGCREKAKKVGLYEEWPEEEPTKIVEKVLESTICEMLH